MIVALLADIHANREALEACLAHARLQRADRFVFLGDIVGYGADPQAAVDIVARYLASGAVAVKGNHDEAVGHPTDRMNADATRAIDWTRERIDHAAAVFLEGLPYTIAEDDTLFVHANSYAPKDWGYVRSEREAELCLRGCDARMVFCGHTHVPALYHMSPLRPPAHFSPLPGREVPLVASRQWLGVIGAVGQPRDGNPAACYALLDTGRSALTMHRVPYDVESAARKVREAGLPESLWTRLLQGR
jgi:diadenosine tetraphosphatase ApaH/serine/threonine PP2A family protein phosphatase